MFNTITGLVESLIRFNDFTGSFGSTDHKVYKYEIPEYRVSNDERHSRHVLTSHYVALRHCFGDFRLLDLHVTRRGRAENSGDAVPDFFPENHRQDGDANDEQESDAVLGHQEGEAVRQVELCQVHVDGVGGHEDDGEPEDDGPVRTWAPASLRRVLGVAGPADEEAEDGEKTLKNINILKKHDSWEKAATIKYWNLFLAK